MSTQIAKIAPRLSTLVEENFEYKSSEIAKIAPKLSTIVGEKTKFATFSGNRVAQNTDQIAKYRPNTDHF